MLSRYSWVASESCGSLITRSIEAAASGLDEDLAVPLDHRIRLDAHRRRQRQHRAGAQVEHRAVAWALDPKAVPVALAERSVVVAAAILDRIVDALDQVHADEQGSGLDDLDAAFGDLPGSGYADFHSI